jgi:hypothetical protein
MKRWYYYKLIKYHEFMRWLYEKEGYLQNYMKVIFHDLRIQRYENKLNISEES